MRDAVDDSVRRRYEGIQNDSGSSPILSLPAIRYLIRWQAGATPTDPLENNINTIDLTGRG